MDDLFAELEQEVAIFMRRAEHARAQTDGVDSMDRSAYLLLNYLIKYGPTPVGHLADAFLLDISTVSRQVAALMQKEYIERDAAADDKRVSVIRVTPTGKAQLATVRAARRRMYEELVGDWSEADRAQFLDLLHRFNERVKARQIKRFKGE